MPILILSQIEAMTTQFRANLGQKVDLSRAPQAAIPATALGQDLATKWGHVFVAKGPAHWAKPHAGMNFSKKLPGLNLQ
mgnify:CR=1 FL=1